jgi:transposase
MSNPEFSRICKAKAKIEDEIRKLVKTKSLRLVVKAVIKRNTIWRPIKERYEEIKANIPAVANDYLKSFAFQTYKDIRDGSVFEARTNYMNCINAIKAGRITHFNLKYKSKRKNGLSMHVSDKMITIDKGTLRFTCKSFSDKTIHVSNRTMKVLRSVTEVKDSIITKKNGVYCLRLPVNTSPVVAEKLTRVVGIDPGVSTFLSGYTSEKSFTIKQTEHCDYYDALKKRLRQLRKTNERKRIRRRVLDKLETKKTNITRELHWQSINYLVKNYDVIFLEKFDSQGFVKGGKSKTLNRRTNNLCPYQFRTRLMYKALQHGKIVEIVGAHHTTKTCSSCGNNQTMALTDRVYECKSCSLVLDRDYNAGKNILMKGLLV